MIIHPGDQIRPMLPMPLDSTSPNVLAGRCRGRARGARSRRLAATAVLTLAALAACGDDTPRPADTTTPTGIANPASEFCIEQGGTVEIVDEEGGQVGYCNLPDGSRVEEWEFMRSQTEASGG